MSNTLLLVISDLLILASLFLLGALVVYAILGKTDRFVLLSLSLGVGGGVLTWFMFLVSWAGLRLSMGTVLWLYAVLTAAAALLAWRTVRSSTIQEESPDPAHDKWDIWLTRSVWILIVILISTAAFLAVGLSYFGWDDIANWAVKGYGIALQGSIFAGGEWGDVGLSYPMNIPLLIALFRFLDGNLLPGSKLLYPAFYASLLIGCYRFLVLHGLKRWIASLGLLLLGTTPIIFTHAYMGYTNLAFAFYLIMGMLWCMDSMKDKGPRKAILGGLLLAMALWTRPEGIAMCIAVVVALVLGRTLSPRRHWDWWALLIPLAIVGGSWFLFLRVHTISYAPGYDLFGLAWRGILKGQIHWSAFNTIFRFMVGQVVRFRDWGFLPLLMGALFILGFRPKNLSLDPAYTSLLFAMLTIGLVLIGLHYMAAYSPQGPGFLYEWLSLDFTRVAMPAGICLTLLGLLSLRDQESEPRAASQDGLRQVSSVKSPLDRFARLSIIPPDMVSLSLSRSPAPICRVAHSNRPIESRYRLSFFIISAHD